VIPEDSPLARLERRIESLVEGTIARLTGEGVATNSLTGQLARAMESGVRRAGPGPAHAPDFYALALHPQVLERLVDQAPSLEPELATALYRAAGENGLFLAREPRVTLVSDATLKPWELRAVAWHGTEPMESTQGMTEAPDGARSASVEGAYLIVDGKKHFALDRPVINIGRRLDNQLILDDSQVSRSHAQLRIRNGRYVLFDLGSTAGTKVNGLPIRQHVLRPGDVISIAEVRMVYGEDPRTPFDTTTHYTPPFPPRPAGDQRTRPTDDQEATE